MRMKIEAPKELLEWAKADYAVNSKIMVILSTSDSMRKRWPECKLDPDVSDDYVLRLEHPSPEWSWPVGIEWRWSFTSNWLRILSWFWDKRLWRRSFIFYVDFTTDLVAHLDFGELPFETRVRVLTAEYTIARERELRANMPDD